MTAPTNKKDQLARLVEWHAEYPAGTAGPWYFLVGVKDGEVVATDGMHGDPEDVTQALKLHEGIAAIRTPGATYRMVVIQDVPSGDPPVNQEAIDALNAMHAAGQEEGS